MSQNSAMTQMCLAAQADSENSFLNVWNVARRPSANNRPSGVYWKLTKTQAPSKNEHNSKKHLKQP